MKFFQLLKAALQAYVAYAEWRQRTYVYKMEDEVDDLAADASPVAKLRIERLSKRLKRERTL